MLLDTQSREPLYEQIYRNIRDNIEQGYYPIDSKLPSIRSIADDLHCSKNTVEAAFRMLVQEGYAIAKPGSGYIVLDLSLIDTADDNESDSFFGTLAPNKNIHYDFSYGNLQYNTFPASQWKSITDDILLSSDRETANIYTDPLGEYELREQIAKRLKTNRSITCSAEQIIIQGGTQASIQNLLCLFNNKTDTVAMENPGYDGTRHAIQRCHFSVVPCDVMHGPEAFLRDVSKSKAQLVSVTPSSQFPTCRAMEEYTRKKLIQWADEHNAYIIEDDYCHDFRYKKRALMPLFATAERDRVIYMSTFSKSLSPALRMNYLVLPPTLLRKWLQIFRSAYPAVPWLSQIVLARFMQSGAWDKHLRRVQVMNLRKYNALINSLTTYFGNTIDVLENGTGLHVLVKVHKEYSAHELIKKAYEAGVRVYPTNQYWIGKQPGDKQYILIGFSSIVERDIEPGIRVLAQAWLN